MVRGSTITKLLSIFLLVVGFGVINHSAQAVAPLWIYDLNPDGQSVTITDCLYCITNKGKERILRIPATVDGGKRIYQVTAIGPDAFAENLLTQITLPAGLQSIGDRAFEGGMGPNSNHLTKLNLPVSLQSIGLGAFQGNQLTKLILPAGLQSIGSSAFSGNPLTKLTFAPKSKLQSIGDRAFSDNNLDQIILPAGLQSIGERAFFKNQLTKLTLSAGSQSIGQEAFSGNKLTQITLPAGLQSVGQEAFRDNQLTKLTFAPNSKLQSIGLGAFQGNQLTKLILPAGLQSIGSSAFSGNPLTKLTFAPKSKLQSIGSWAFSLSLVLGVNKSKITQLTLPASLRSIGPGAFYNNQLTQITLPAGLQSIGEGNAFTAFANNPIQSLSVDSGNPNYSVQDNVLFDKPGTTLLWRPGNLGDHYVVPVGVQSIGDRAFYNNQLTQITLPAGLQSIGGWAFYNNPLAALTFLGNAPSDVDTDAFYGLYTLTLPRVIRAKGLTGFGSNGDLWKGMLVGES